MYFKVRGILYMALMFCLSSCGLRIGEKAPADRPIAFAGSGFSCLSQLGEKLEAFLGARLSDDEIRQFGHCVRFAFESFANYTRGEDRNSYAPAEIRDFLQAYFLRDRKISDELLAGFMTVKQSLVGGASDRISRQDLAHAIDFISFIEEQALRLNPYMVIYNFRIGQQIQNREGQLKNLDVAIRQLRLVGEALGQRLGQANHPYEMAQLESFMREFRSFAGWEEVFENARDPGNWVKFFSAYKTVVSGGESERVQPQEWASLLVSSAGWYGLTLKARYVRDQSSVWQGHGLESLIHMVDEAVHLLREAVDAQPDALVSYQQMDLLLEALPAVNLMPQVRTVGGSQSLSPRAVKSALRPLVDRVFGDTEIDWKLRQSEGVSRFTLAQISAEFSRWADVQRLLERIFPDVSQGLADSKQIPALADRLGPGSTFKGLSFKSRSDDGFSTNSALMALRQIEQNVRPLFRPQELEVFLVEKERLGNHGVVHGFFNMSVMNAVRAALALLIRGYSSYKGGEGYMNSGLTEDEMQAFYMDFRQMGVDLGIFDARSDSSGRRAFREANMFTYAGNGLVDLGRAGSAPIESMMNFTEGMEYISFLVSEGVLATHIYQGFAKGQGQCASGALSSPRQANGLFTFNRSCFEEGLVEVLLPHISNFPGMESFLKHGTEEEKRSFAASLMRVIYSQQWSDPRYVDWGEITMASAILHYTESVLTRYNADQDAVLSDDEVWAAYQTFAGYMRALAIQQCETYMDTWSKTPPPEVAPSTWGWDEGKERLRRWIRRNGCSDMPDFVPSAVFAFIVKEGRVPESLWEVNFLPRVPWIGVEFSVTRTDLIRVFGALVRANAESVKRH